jgi:hypothetical protein
MQGSYLFEYAVVRVVPKVEREEFLNVGVVVYCAEKKFLQAIFQLDEERLRAFCVNCDVLEIKEYLSSFQRICTGGSEAGPIGKMALADRFRWLTATRSTVIQTSNVHSGLSSDIPQMLIHLYKQLVLQI